MPLTFKINNSKTICLEKYSNLTFPNGSKFYWVVVSNRINTTDSTWRSHFQQDNSLADVYYNGVKIDNINNLLEQQTPCVDLNFSEDGNYWVYCFLKTPDKTRVEEYCVYENQITVEYAPQVGNLQFENLNTGLCFEANFQTVYSLSFKIYSPDVFADGNPPPIYLDTLIDPVFTYDRSLMSVDQQSVQFIRPEGWPESEILLQFKLKTFREFQDSPLVIELRNNMYTIGEYTWNIDSLPHSNNKFYQDEDYVRVINEIPNCYATNWDSTKQYRNGVVFDSTIKDKFPNGVRITVDRFIDFKVPDNTYILNFKETFPTKQWENIGSVSFTNYTVSNGSIGELIDSFYSGPDLLNKLRHKLGYFVAYRVKFYPIKNGIPSSTCFIDKMVYGSVENCVQCINSIPTESPLFFSIAECNCRQSIISSAIPNIIGISYYDYCNCIQTIALPTIANVDSIHIIPCECIQTIHISGIDAEISVIQGCECIQTIHRPTIPNNILSTEFLPCECIETIHQTGIPCELTSIEVTPCECVETIHQTGIPCELTSIEVTPCECVETIHKTTIPCEIISTELTPCNCVETIYQTGIPCEIISTEITPCNCVENVFISEIPCEMLSTELTPCNCVENVFISEIPCSEFVGLVSDGPKFEDLPWRCWEQYLDFPNDEINQLLCKTAGGAVQPAGI